MKENLESQTRILPAKAWEEVEVKIGDIADADEVARKIVENGGELVEARRLLRDAKFKLKEPAKISGEFALSLNGLSDQPTFRDAIVFLGLEIKQETSDGLTLAPADTGSSNDSIPKRSVRIREDGGRLTFSVKALREGDRISRRREIEIPISAQDKDELVVLLDKIGYVQSPLMEKYRTTWRIGKTLVELNEGPVSPPWIELESENGDSSELLELTRKLGYDEGNLSTLSDREYHRSHGADRPEVWVFGTE